jgi:Fur family ferric uptake transcriptional regulator
MDINNILIKSGYNLTKPRLEVFNCLRESNQLLSAGALHKKIKNIDQASVYRALSLFEELRLVNIEVIKQEKLYCLANHPHHHIICRQCGYLEDFPCEKQEEYKKFSNFTDIEHHLTLIGVCVKCRSKI